jgi:hypothetical protein
MMMMRMMMMMMMIVCVGNGRMTIGSGIEVHGRYMTF